MRLAFKAAFLSGNVILSILPTICFFIYSFSNVKRKNFLKPFFFGVLCFIVNNWVKMSIVSNFSEFDVNNLKLESFSGWFIFMLYNIVGACFSVFSRVLVFNIGLKKEQNEWFSNGVSLAFGYCALYNLIYGGITILRNFDSLLDVSFKSIVKDALDNFNIIISDIGFTVLIFFILIRKFKFRWVYIVFIMLFEFFTTTSSEFIVLYLKNGLYHFFEMVLVVAIYTAITIVLWFKFKRKKFGRV